MIKNDIFKSYFDEVRRIVKNFPSYAKEIKTYRSDLLKAIFFGLLISAIIGLVSELELLFRTEYRLTYDRFGIQSLSRLKTIDQLLAKIDEDPGNYYALIKLGNAYLENNEIEKAEKCFRRALIFSNRSNYALFSYAVFYAKTNKFFKSATIAEELSIKYKTNLKYKSEIYEAIGDKSIENHEYEAALRAYQISLKYAKNMNKRKYLKKIEDKYAYSYIKLADKNIESHEPEEAATNLMNSIKINDSPIAHYKLSLILKDASPVQAESHMYKAFVGDPYVVNPEIYYNLLNSLYEEESKKIEHSSANFYKIRIKDLKRKISEYYIFKNDISISEIKFVPSKKFKDLSSNIVNPGTLGFILTNNTDKPIKSLYLKIEYVLPTGVYPYEKKIVHPYSPFYEKSFLEVDNIPISEDIPPQMLNNQVRKIIKIYLKKKYKAPYTLIRISTVNF